MISKIGFEPFLNVFDLSMVQKSCYHKNAVISKNCIKSGIAPVHSKLIYFEVGTCELTFSKALQKRKQVQKFYAENTDQKPVKMTKKLGFLFFTGAESALSPMFLWFAIHHEKGLLLKKESSKSIHRLKRNLRSKFESRSF